MNKLFACYLGGSFEGCSIEMHDLMFCVGNTLDECLPILKSKWAGDSLKLHIDSYIELLVVDNYEVIIISKKPKNDELKLYALNVGWSEEGYFGERHCIEFVVASSENEAIKKVNNRNDKTNKIDFHIDNRMSVDNCITITDQIDHKFYISLIPTQTNTPNQIINCYKKI